MNYVPLVQRHKPEQPIDFFDDITISELDLMISVTARLKRMSPEAQDMISEIAGGLVEINDRKQLTT